jgi:RNA polymerase sigma-70 factor, ECF subfamily
MRDDAGMRCEVAREALSARMDGEQPLVLAQQVDAHLESCRRCRTWLIGAAAQTRRITWADAGRGPDLTDQIMAAARPSRRWLPGPGSRFWRGGLIGIGVFQVLIAAAQIIGIDFGIMSAHAHGGMGGMNGMDGMGGMHHEAHEAQAGAHLLHESTAWLLALGLAMIAAGIWTGAAVGVAAIAGAYSLALVYFVSIDAWHGQVTAARIASHIPVLAGMLFALLVARDRSGARRSRSTDAEAVAPAEPAATSRRRRRGHLRPINRSTTPGRISAEPRLRLNPMTAASDDEAVTGLALAAADGDAQALEAFIRATQQDVWRFVTYLSDAASADDLTQETFLRAIGAIQRFSGRSSARTWLLSIARRVVADHIRHIQARPRTAHAADAEYLLGGDRHARGFEDLVEVTAMIADLTTEQREALLLTQLLGLSYADAAAVCGCPVGTIRSRVARARDALLAADADRDGLTG